MKTIFILNELMVGQQVSQDNPVLRGSTALRILKMDGLMKTTHPTNPLPFNEWAKYIRKETDKQYNISAKRLIKSKK
jgi:hypothetical protein